MSESGFSKRQFLRLGAGASGALFLENACLGQSDRIFGIKLPKEVAAVLPQKQLNLVRAVDTVLRLEREADAKGLARSTLSREQSGSPINAGDDSIYQALLPRLVNLIDRTELQDLGLADQAGALLAEVHAMEHEVPEALQYLLPLNTINMAKQNRSSNDRFNIDGTAQAMPDIPQIELPPAVDPSQPSEPPVVVVSEPPIGDPVPKAPVEIDLPEPQLPEVETPSNEPLRTARDYASLKTEYTRLFQTMEIDPRFSESTSWHLAMLRKSKPRYENVGQQVGVPWYFIAATHALEASFNFRAHLHNGDFPLTSRTRQVPAGRPTKWLPPADWESSAKDALRLLGYVGQKDWSLERTLYRLEAYNGLGYRGRRIATPYLWCYSNHYKSGKFVADGKWNPNARSKQCGAAVMLKMLEQSNEISFS
jgi:lysozyme family protein